MIDQGAEPGTNPARLDRINCSAALSFLDTPSNSSLDSNSTIKVVDDGCELENQLQRELYAARTTNLIERTQGTTAEISAIQAGS